VFRKKSLSCVWRGWPCVAQAQPRTAMKHPICMRNESAVQCSAVQCSAERVCACARAASGPRGAQWCTPAHPARQSRHDAPPDAFTPAPFAGCSRRQPAANLAAAWAGCAATAQCAPPSVEARASDSLFNSGTCCSFDDDAASKAHRCPAAAVQMMAASDRPFARPPLCVR
jgi:hypothetical protein